MRLWRYEIRLTLGNSTGFEIPFLVHVIVTVRNHAVKCRFITSSLLSEIHIRSASRNLCMAPLFLVRKKRTARAFYATELRSNALPALDFCRCFA